MKMRSVLLILVLALLVSLFAVGCNETKIEEIPAEEEYVYVNPDETKAETDAGFKIDGVLDEAFYKNNNWLYLANKTGGTDVEIAMTSYFGEKGMYFAYDVTEGNPIYVNLDRPSYLNSGIELHLAPSTVSNMKGNSVFEINLLPSGDMTFKKSNGKGNFVNVETTNDIMAVLGTTTKGGELNTADCYGYCMELFIPWEYMEKFDLDTAAMKAGYVYSGLAHITSFNEMGTNMDVDRYWYSFDVQNGASWSNVYQYFRFDKDGIQGTVPVTFTAGEHYKVEGAPAVIPGMPMNVTITPEAGYTITSILINGEECIDKAIMNEDGSVSIRERGVAGGVEISAVAQAVTEGNKTLTGKVIAHKLGGGSLKNVQASYKGPTGEKLLELDANGKFKLENLKPGNYTIIIEQAGYKKLSRTIHVNRDMDVELFLEYDLFAATGDAWILDDQNDGILYKFGGSGELLTNDKYGKFTVSANFKFDKDLVNEGTATVFTEQRQGLKIAFSNGKVWHVDLLKQDGKYYVQYAKHSENALTGWKKVYELTSAEAAKYTSQQGIQLSIQRDGKYANVYLDGKLVSQEVLDSAYAGLTAQIGFEGWAANREVMTVPFKITTSTSVNLRNTFFKMKDGWDVSRQYNGLLVKTSDDVSKMSFLDKYVNMNLTVTARDYADKGNTASRTDILFAFDNGKQISFGIDAGGKQVQSMYGENAGYINTGWKTWGKLTEEEVALLQGEGLAFKVVRYGTEVTLYVNGRMVGVADLTENGSGVTATMPATVSIRHYEDKGVKIEIPFQVSNTYDKVTVTVDDALATDKAQYFVGDTVKITAKDSNYLVSSLKVNGEDVAVSVDGTASFVVTEKEYAVTGEVTKSIFKPDSQWDLTKQFEGVLVIPSRTGNYATVQTTDSTYRDVSVTVRDEVSGTFKMQVYFVFGEGREFQIRLHNENTNGQYRVQKMSTSLVSGWSNLYTLNADEVALLTGTEGITFRVAIVGTKAIALINNVQVGTVDLGSAISATETAKINLIMYGNNNKKNVTIPFTLGAEPKVTTVTVPESTENGTITVNTTNAIAGQTITLKATPNGGYNLVDLVVTKDGTPVDLGKIDPEGFTYSWEADGGNYAVTGKFGLKIFQNTEYFDLREQENGSVTLLKGATSARTLKTVSSLYREIAVTVRDQEKGTFKTEFHFVFGENREFQIRLDNETGAYRIQKMATTLSSGWKDLYTLNADEAAALKSETGIKFRVALVGAYAMAYVGDVAVGQVDLSSGIAANATAQIAVVLYGNEDVENIQIPYVLGMGAAASTVQVASGITGGSVSADKTLCAAGETVTLTVTPNEGYNLVSLTVKKDGTPVSVGDVTFQGGKFTFQAEEGAYTVDATFQAKIFQDAENWDLTKQYAGVAIIREGNSKGRTLKTYANTYRDITTTVTDHEEGTFKAEYHFVFGEGREFQIRLHNEGTNGEYRVQKMSTSLVSGWSNLYTLSDAEVALLKSETGIKFRVAIVGTYAMAFINDVQVGMVDLTGKITTEKAQIAVVMYGNDGVKNIQIPYELGEGLAAATVTVSGTSNGSLTASKTVCIAGETVTIQATPADGYNLASLVVKKNGTPVDLGKIALSGGSFQLVTEEGKYTVEATFKAKIFQDAANWDLTGQYDGTVTILKGNKSGRTLKTYTSAYRDVAVTVRDHEQQTFKTEFHFIFGEGKEFQIRLHNEGTNGAYKVQKMSTSLVSGWSNLYTLNADQVAALKSESGIRFQVTIEGTKAVAYIGGAKVGEVDLTGKITTEMAKIAIVIYGNDGVENIEIPFTLGAGPAVSTVKVADGITNGQVAVNKTACAKGDTITVTATPEGGYNLKSLTVKKNGAAFKTIETRLAGGEYTFEATEEGAYTVEAEFAKPLFYIGTGSNDTDDRWDFANQYNGQLTVNRVGTYARLYTTESTYRDVSVKVSDLTPTYGSNGKGNFKMQIYFTFADGDEYQIRLHNENADGKYKVQNMDKIVSGWTALYTLNAAQTADINSETGVTFRVALEGTYVVAYINGAEVGRLNLSSKVGATETAKITLIMYGNNNQQDMVIPFTLGK